jgi:hypothetical protein
MARWAASVSDDRLIVVGQAKELSAFPARPQHSRPDSAARDSHFRRKAHVKQLPRRKSYSTLVPLWFYIGFTFPNQRAW